MKTKRIRGTNVNEPDLFDKNGYGVCQELFDGIVDFLNGPMEDIEVDIAEEDLDAELASPLDDLTTLSCIFGTDASKREERKKLPPVSDTTEMKSFFRGMENKSGQKVITAASSTSSAPDAQRKCMHCKVTTPQWKKGPLGPHTLCNACGVCYKSGRLYRPNFGAPSNFQRKVIELANIVENTSSRSIPLLNDFPRKKRSCPFHTPDCCASKRFHPLAASAPFYASSDYPKALFPKNTNKKQKRKNRKKSSGSSGKSSVVEIKIKPVHKDAIAASSIFLAALHSNSSEKVVETVDKTGQEAITASSTIIAPLHSISCKNDVVTANKTGRKVALAENPTSVTSLSANSPKMNSLQVKVKDKKCMHCGVKSTPQWRNGPLGMCTLCNACGVRYRSGRLFPEYRPLASPTFVPSLHSNFHRKVLEKRKKVCKEAAVTTTNGNNSPARFDLNELPELDELPDLKV